MNGFDRSYIRRVRHALQWGIFFYLLYAGYRFAAFVSHFSSSSNGAAPPVTRPPSVEGFLPIGALMSLKLWVTTGIFDQVHPAGLVIFLAALLISLLLKKGFCGWICPVGTLSDLAGMIGRRLFGRNFRMHRYADYPLRSLKYLLLFFFVYAIVVRMPSFLIFRFVEGDYYKIADVKLLYFFTEMSSVTLFTLIALFGFSLIYRNFWCRYLCPYGALLGILSVLSPLKIRRDDEACTHCSRCSRNCPSGLPVDKKTIISSPECTGCLTCVGNCPSRGALDVGPRIGPRLHPLLFAALIAALLFGSAAVGMLTGRWHSSVTPQEYRQIIPQASALEHP